jgi:hypothetical protein
MYSNLMAQDTVRYIGKKFAGEFGPKGDGSFTPGEISTRVGGKLVVVFRKGDEGEQSIICSADVLEKV